MAIFFCLETAKIFEVIAAGCLQREAALLNGKPEKGYYDCRGAEKSLLFQGVSLFLPCSCPVAAVPLTPSCPYAALSPPYPCSAPLRPYPCPVLSYPALSLPCPVLALFLLCSAFSSVDGPETDKQHLVLAHFTIKPQSFARGLPSNSPPRSAPGTRCKAFSSPARKTFARNPF